MPRISTDNYDTVASWNGSQDLFVVEQPDGTKVATPAMVKQYVLGNSIDDIYSVMGQNGAKNLIPYPYNHTTKTQNGVTFTDNGDGTITIVTSENGATANTTFEFQTRVSEKLFLKAGKYTATGCPLIAGGGIVFKITNTNVSPSLIFNDTGSGVTFTLENDLPFGAIFTVSKNTVITTPIVVKPMLRLAADTDNTYQPYAMTNKQLTDELDTAREQIANKIKKLPTQTTRYKFTAANTYEYTGVSVTCPAGHTYIVRAFLAYSNSEPKGIVASARSDRMYMYDCYAREELATSITFMLVGGESAYIWGKGTTTNGDDVILDIIDITN